VVHPRGLSSCRCFSWIKRRVEDRRLHVRVPSAAGVFSALFFAVLRFFAVFVGVLNDALEDEEVGAALTGQFDAVAVVPFHGTAKGLTAGRNILRFTMTTP